METQYHIVIDEKRQGPFAKNALVGAGMQPSTLVWFEGCPDWLPAREVPELAALFAEQSEHPLYSTGYLQVPFGIAMLLFRFAQFAGALCGTLLFLALLVGFEAGGFWNNERGASFALSAAYFMLLLTVLCASVASLVGLFHLFRCWKVIQDDNVRVSPVTAIGLLFVPVFNLYWIFIATAGLAVELHRYAARHRLKAPRASVLLGIAISLYILLAAAPVIGYSAWLLNLLLLPMFMRSIHRTACCFCVENREPQNDETALRRPLAARSAFVAGMFATLVAPIAVPLCVSGCLITPLPYAVYLDWAEPQRKKPAPVEPRPPHFDPANARRLQVHELKKKLGVDVEKHPEVLGGVVIVAFVGGILLLAAALCGKSAASANAERDAKPPEEGYARSVAR